MANILSNEQIKFYHNKGFLFPFDLYNPEEAKNFHSLYNKIEEDLGYEPQKEFRIKAHLPFPWLCDIVNNSRLLDAVEDLIGPNVLCWGASFFAKAAKDPRFVSYHTDTFTYGFEPAETCTAWLSFNEASTESGCINYIPGSHKLNIKHEIHADNNNLLTQGQNVIGVDLSEAVSAPLKAGQVVFHHESVVHGSGPNKSENPRVGLSIHYCAPHVRETRIPELTALHLRGFDTSGNWRHDPLPRHDYDKKCIDVMKKTRALFVKATKEKINKNKFGAV